MNECPYCYARVKPDDSVCPNCGREIGKWQTGFYTKQPLTARSRTAVWAAAIVVLLLILLGFARSCHWF
jgi:predicted amidophosphoribosyltransferase